MGSSGLEVAKEEAEESAPYSSCSNICKGDCSFVVVEGMEVGATVEREVR